MPVFNQLFCVHVNLITCRHFTGDGDWRHLGFKVPLPNAFEIASVSYCWEVFIMNNLGICYINSLSSLNEK